MVEKECVLKGFRAGDGRVANLGPSLSGEHRFAFLSSFHGMVDRLSEFMRSH